MLPATTTSLTFVSKGVCVKTHLIRIKRYITPLTRNAQRYVLSENNKYSLRIQAIKHFMADILYYWIYRKTILREQTWLLAACERRKDAHEKAASNHG